MSFSFPQTVGRLDGSGRRFAVIGARFNESLADRLVEGATATLAENGVAESDVLVIRVPGAWEVPQAAEAVAATGNVDGVVALGVVIRGETPHFDYLCAECGTALSRVASKYGLPVSFGVLTCDTAEQAEERAGGRVGNKGREAAQAALEMANLFADLRS